VDVWTLVRAIYALVVIAAVLAALRFGLRELARRRLSDAKSDARFVRVLETALLPHDAALVVVRAGNAYQLIGVGRVTTICEVPAEVAARVVAAQR
jgi:flagellar biogenesis protein FliO